MLFKAYFFKIAIYSFGLRGAQPKTHAVRIPPSIVCCRRLGRLEVGGLYFISIPVSV